MSVTVEELRAHIATIDSEIQLQRKLLEKLERDKSLAQRQLNVALDPVARLPLEISSQIFLHALPTSPSEEQDVPTVLLRICHAWTDIALDTPPLWTTFCIHFPCSDHFAEVLPIWFRRARNFPLSVSIFLCGPSSNWNHCVSDELWRHGGQLKHLEILDNDGLDPDDGLDLFGDTTSVSLPFLQTLTIRCQREQRVYLASRILQLLRGAPNIAEIIFDQVRTQNNLHSEILVLPTLRRLIHRKFTSINDYIFHYLALPALESFSLRTPWITGDGLVAFFERSAPPLWDWDLTRGWQPDGIQPFHLHKCLRLIPTLTRFTLREPDSNAVAELFAALAESPSLLANLHNLTIQIRNTSANRITNPWWRNLVRALSTRPVEQLYIVPVEVSPPMDVLTSLQELAAAGAKMHVGTEEQNFVIA
ncbi:F-box domain-containing protein [Mycena sanguinolenta]|uniref:F-box domain-containing protein n=1 Tax=Mycena sanguinolenta TaxID=230812 RepID=A0A8H7DLH0_9AGAR|nr:F-box domain-containing protein [Mycena sanguinolenta]